MQWCKVDETLFDLMVADEEHRKIIGSKIADYHFGGNGLEKIRTPTRLIESILTYHSKPAYSFRAALILARCF
jgi:hypothetical protein